MVSQESTLARSLRDLLLIRTEVSALEPSKLPFCASPPSAHPLLARTLPFSERNIVGGDKAAERNAQIQGILEQIMEASAYERLQRIKIVKKEKAAAIENQLVQMATSGKLPGKISETRLIQMLEGGQDAPQTKVKIQRRNYGLDSDDSDDNDDDLM